MAISLSPAQTMVMLKGVALYGSDSLVGSVLESSHDVLRAQDFSPKSTAVVARALESGSAWHMRGSLLYLGQMPNAVRTLSRGDSKLEQLVGIDANDVIESRKSDEDRLQYHPYQATIIRNVRRDVREGKYPWLGIAAPMQTGKSSLIPPLISELQMDLGKVPVLILTTARVITRQTLEDLQRYFPSHEVGRFDGEVKQTDRRITVASIWSLARHLKRFSPDRFKVIFNDEAYLTQTKSFGRTLSYFGVAKVVDYEGQKQVVPHSGGPVLIGLSGTSVGLQDYHISGQLGYEQAIEEGWIRELEGDFVPIEGEKVNKRLVGENVVWWKPTMENARKLARLYGDRIHGQYEKNLVYVPTKRWHAPLMQNALEELYGTGRFPVVHSELDQSEINDQVAAWQHGDVEALLSIRMLGVGFRGTGAGAVFHTYQSTSTELVSNRTGRAWGYEEIGKQSKPLYVLEASWQRGSEFANVARIFGLAEYPQRRFRSNEAPGLRIRQKVLKGEEGKAHAKLLAFGATTSVKGLPHLPEWRDWFEELQRISGKTLREISDATGIDEAVLQGYALGFLPIRRNEIEGLGRVIEAGEDHILSLWVMAWGRVAKEIMDGLRRLKRSEEHLLEWSQQQGTLEGRVAQLDAILGEIFKIGTPRFKRPLLHRSFRLAIEQSRDEIEAGAVRGRTIAIRAWELYCREVRGKQRLPGKQGFVNLTGGKKSDPKIVAMLDEAGITKLEYVDRDMAKDCFKQAALQMLAVKPPQDITYQAVAELALESYGERITESDHMPSIMTFYNLVQGDRADSEFIQILKSLGLRKRVVTDPDLAYEAFRQAIVDARESGDLQSLTWQKIACRACDVFAARFVDDNVWPPSQSTFHQLISGKKKDPRIIKLLEESGLKKRRKVAVDRTVVKARLREALRLLQANPPARNGRIRTGHVIEQVQTLYEVAGETSIMPSKSWLDKAFSEDIGDPEFLALLDQGGVTRIRRPR